MEAEHIYALRREAWRAKRRFTLAARAMAAAIEAGAQSAPGCFPVCVERGKLRLIHEDWRRWANE